MEKTIAFRSEELDNGAILTADIAKFDAVFKKNPVPKSDQVKYTTQGTVVDQRVRRTK